MARGQQKSVTGMRSGKAGGRRPSFNPAGAGKTLVRQMMLLPIMYIGSTMDWTATATFYAEATLLGVLVLGSLAIQVSIFLAQRKKEVAKVFDVGDATLMLDAEQINADGSVAAHAYDTAKLKMLRMQLIIAGVVVWFAHVRMGYQALSRGALTHTREWWTAGRATEPPRQPTRPGAAPRGQLWAGGAALGLQGSAHTPARRRREAPVGHHGCQPCPAVGREAKGGRVQGAGQGCQGRCSERHRHRQEQQEGQVMGQGEGRFGACPVGALLGQTGRPIFESYLEMEERGRFSDEPVRPASHLIFAVIHARVHVRVAVPPAHRTCARLENMLQPHVFRTPTHNLLFIKTLQTRR